jgi:hypothetical protein
MIKTRNWGTLTKCATTLVDLTFVTNAELQQACSSYIDRDAGEKANAWDVEENCGWQ